MPDCWFFAQGRCSKGDACPFSHAAAGATREPAPHPPQPHPSSHLRPGAPAFAPREPAPHPSQPLASRLRPGAVAFAPPAAVAHPPTAAVPPPPPRVPYPSGPVYSIDVECVATDTTHAGRAVAQIALVDGEGRPVLNLYVRPDVQVYSYLTGLTSLTRETIDAYGISLCDALARLRACLPPNACLVGQNIQQDVRWLGLRQGVDFGEFADLAALCKAWNPAYRAYTCFSLDHVAGCWLGERLDGAAHDAVGDAVKSVHVYHHRRALDADPAMLQAALDGLLAAPPTPSFSSQHPTYDGVCMGNRKTCACGAPFRSSAQDFGG